jgi:CheY-like chemotaxis protein
LTHLTAAERAVQQAGDTARQLLIFSQGGAPLTQPTDLGPLLHDATHFVLAYTSIQRVVSMAANLWLVEADNQQIRQAIYQITLNAVQAMPTGGMLHIKAENVSSATPLPVLLAAGPYVRITISDQGKGIPAAARDRIFEPYFTTNAQHSGLGLATAYAIVQKHGGCMHVESIPGVGTTMQIYLPAVPTTHLTLQAQPTPVSAEHGKILIMDDEESIRLLLAEMLSRLGYEVASASDGAAALDLYRRAQHAGTPFTAIVMDLVILKGMGGKETMAKLRELDPEVKAIVSSGYSNDPIMTNFQQYGFCGRLPKPYQLSDLSTVLHQVLQPSAADRG